MIKKLAVVLLTALSLASGASTLHASDGIFGTDIGLESNLINSGTNTFFEADLLGDSRHAPIATAAVTLPVDLNTSGFNGLNLGTFDVAAGDTLNLVGGEALTFKNSGSDVTAAFVNYSVDGGPFVAVNLPFNQDNVNGNSGDQRWATDTASVNLLAGLADGTHTLAFFASGTTNGGDIFDSNGGANYTADFTVVPEPSTIAAGVLALLGTVFLRRRQVAA